MWLREPPRGSCEGGEESAAVCRCPPLSVQAGRPQECPAESALLLCVWDTGTLSFGYGTFADLIICKYRTY